MSKIETETHTHRAKDGLYYKDYESMRDANVKANNFRLEKLGLGDSYLKQKAANNKNKKRKTPAKPPSPPVTELRRSNRVRMVTPEFPLLDEEALVPRPKKKKPPPGSRAFDPNEMEALKNLPNWLEGMEEFLLTVPHGAGNKVVSRDNARSVMKQTRRMVGGLGIEYHHWDEGVVWKKGVKFDLSMNFDALHDEAVEFEAKHGRDLGNGWLMRHPIRKLQCYQEYLADKNKESEEKQEVPEAS